MQCWKWDITSCYRRISKIELKKNSQRESKLTKSASTQQTMHVLFSISPPTHFQPVWARGHCRISPPCFLAKCCKRQLNQSSFVLQYFRLFTFSDLYWVCLSVFSLLFCLSVSVKWLAVKTASEMTYIVSGGALNCTQTQNSKHPFSKSS